jgi:hypothetical protein
MQATRLSQGLSRAEPDLVAYRAAGGVAAGGVERAVI